ncbi:ArsC family reductase [Sphingomonas changnyeongensis]|uniref:ArsC family reductase n=1 Tax=Sphingomonas changnyeongensis TaxID=2698679 RepID=A0A7Z2S643_9SPHN|nr:ArsC family reductase [Sphingomonas changnyeongensis]QHL91078.1 ArsC family reductase [Sphingomonas changnyeongensis]
MTELVVYGIPNCDTVKKSRAWLDAAGIAYRFHDYKKAGVDEAALRRWVAALGWEALVNRQGTTFRKLPEAERTGLDEARAIALMIANPSLIRRPVVEGRGQLLAGFSPERFAVLTGG